MLGIVVQKKKSVVAGMLLSAFYLTVVPLLGIILQQYVFISTARHAEGSFYDSFLPTLGWTVIFGIFFWTGHLAVVSARQERDALWFGSLFFIAGSALILIFEGVRGLITY